MAKLIGGLHGRPSGNVGGVVYGAARTRLGKVVTARELVYPSNPQSAGQVLQRHKFSEALFAVRHLGATLWQNDFNRAIGQLPGFQSMMSIILSNTDALEDFNTPPATPLGNLHYAGAMAAVTGVGAAGTVDLSWTAELGLNGTAADVIEVFGVEKLESLGQVRGAVNFAATGVRADTSLIVPTGSGNMVFQVGVYWQGAGTAVGLLSECKWFEVTSKA